MCNGILNPITKAIKKRILNIKVPLTSYDVVSATII